MGTHPIFESDFNCLTERRIRGVVSIMEDPVNQLANYRLQLGQVEAALTGDPENAELLSLKSDLDEIITITSELISDSTPKTTTWKIGMTVLAPYSSDNKMYEAIVNELDSSAGTAKVKFANYTTIETVLISQLSEFKGKKTERGTRWGEDNPARAPLPSTTMDNDPGINSKAAREKQRIEIEKRRKKAAKKKDRLAAMDAAGERQKKSWQSFNTKVVKKKKAGVTSKSIFKTPQGNNGMVGVGTCGLGDRGMTESGEAARYNARHLAPNK